LLLVRFSGAAVISAKATIANAAQRQVLRLASIYEVVFAGHRPA